MTKLSADKKGADKLFEKWKSDFRDKPKNKDNIYTNFNDLFFEMSRNFISSDIAYEYLKPAVAKHIPDNYIVDRTYNNSSVKKMQSKTEFFENWKNLILDKATQAFYDVYPLESEQNKQEVIQLPKGMSKREYTLQRKHIEEFEHVDLEMIRNLYKQIQDEGVTSFDDILGDLSGSDKPR